MSFINRNLLVLFACQTIFVSGSILLVTIGGIVGSELTTDPALATLPVAIMVVGTALATVPAAFSMQHLGRRWGFALGAGIAACGAWLATYALDQASFRLFCLATGLVGASLGFSQQFRFAAAESVSIDKVSNAVSFILLGSISGAFLGPELVARSAQVDPSMPYSFGFTFMIGLYLLAGVLLLSFSAKQADSHADDSEPEPARSFSQLLSQPLFVTAVLAGVVGQGVMTYVMTATPISMTVEESFSLRATSEVIRAHVIAMYLPSLVTPWLIGWLGLTRMMTMGAVITALTLAIGLAGQHLMHYWFALVLLGIGWNFLFVGGTTQLVQSYRSSERFRAQAFNDFSVFGASALASLFAGTMLHAFGWHILLISAAPALLVMLSALRWSSRNAATS